MRLSAANAASGAVDAITVGLIGGSASISPATFTRWRHPVCTVSVSPSLIPDFRPPELGGVGYQRPQQTRKEQAISPVPSQALWFELGQKLDGVIHHRIHRTQQRRQQRPAIPAGYCQRAV